VSTTIDAIVIGAGLSGLVCATRLVAGGARVVVLEARERVGGRLHTGRVGGAVVDLGGAWMTPGQTRLAALARELDIAIEHHDRTGRALLDDRGGLRAAFAQWRAMRRIERLSRSVSEILGDTGYLVYEITSARAGELRRLDSRSFADWLDREVRHPMARDRIALHADLTFSADPADLSLLHYLRTMRATSGFRPEGDDEYRFAGGAQQLAVRLADRLGERIRLGEAVTAIEQTESEIIVRTTQGYRAERAVLAIPPPLARDIAVELPAPARVHVDKAFGGPVVKCFAAFPQPTWRERGLSGESYQRRGAVRATVEASSDPPVLLAFVVGAEAARWSSRNADDRRAEVLAACAPLCGDSPLDYLEIDWGAERWSAGCVPGLPPGALSAGAQWREPHGRLHVAGTESATVWPGYMEGAIDAGERAASEVLAALFARKR
jgi:monoamine oxidase